MAIQKSKNLKSGIEGNYWRITRISVEVDSLQVTLELALFKDKQSSDDGKDPILTGKNYQIPFTREELLSGNMLALGYQRIMGRANTMVKPLFGKPSDPLISMDPDLAGGEFV